jgi:exosortase/archaeosortase family protein
MSLAKRVVMLAAILLFAVWLAVNWGRVTGEADASIRFTLGMLFAGLMILRHKSPDEHCLPIPDLLFPLAVAGGMLAAVGGLILHVHMLEWAGVLTLLFACSFWVSPRRFRADLILAFVILFWVHPLPGQVFGWLQGAMQRLSVQGSELVLHGFNVRVWGDGTVLRTGYQNFLVPEACSGMRTSVTVFLCALGLGMLLRLRWWETIGFILLGLAQVLALNITRISYMVIWAPRMPPEWAKDFLHESLGLFLLGAIVLVQVEAVWWRWWSRQRAQIREGILNRELESPDKASIIPHPIRRLAMILLVLAGSGIAGFGTFAVLYKSRPSHRKEMIREVAVGLMETDPASAHLALKETRKLFPADTELLALEAQASFILSRFEEGLAHLDEIEGLGGTLDLRQIIMKGWALTRIGRLTEARALVDTLPPASDRIPGVAMLKAEFAAMDAQPAEAARHLLVASGSHTMLPRIRALFPYLARHEQWRAIATADHDRPYAEIYQALIALHANQQIGNLSGLTRVMEQALKRWPDDPRLMGTLFDIASRRQGGDWIARFERNFRANIGRMNADMLSTAAEYAWRLMRPDLAWLAHLHMERVSPGDPELIMAPARYGPNWTRFRRHQLLIPSDTPDRMIDLAPVMNLFAQTRPIADFRRRIPQVDAVGKAAVDRQAARRYLEQGVAALEALDEQDALNERYMRLFPMALAMLDRFDEAHARLDRISSAYPGRAGSVQFLHAALYDQQAAWQQSYEALREYTRQEPYPNLTAELLRINALMNLNLAVCAMQVLQEARRNFPGAVRLDLAESAIWDVFGHKAQALHILTQSPAGNTSTVAVGLLYATGRLSEAQRLSSAHGIAPPPGTVNPDPPIWLPPAMLALTPRWPSPPGEGELKTRITQLGEEIGNASSPFIRALRGLMLEWAERLLAGDYAQADTGRTADWIARWESAGRNPLEKTGALYELAMLAARQRDAALARAALRAALVHAPASAVVWRALVALSADDAETVRTAAVQCPEDSELFLADLVIRVREAADDAVQWAAIRQRIEAAAADTRFAPEALIRAGDLLLASGQPELADHLARAALPRAQGLLAAHVLTLRTALLLGDSNRAIAATVRSIEQARDPVPFYRLLVDLKVARREVDNDLLAALEYLQANRRNEPRWAEALGSLYFQKGDMRRALTIFGSVIDEDTKGVQVRTLLLAAEAARLDAKSEYAIRILEAAYALHPEQVSVLNNLVYLLAQNPKAQERARKLLPKLLELGGDRFAVMDTAAMVALRSGDTAEAEIWMEKALAMLDEGEYAAGEVRLNAAEVQLRSGDADAARRTLSDLRRDPARTSFIDQRARQLLREIDMMPGKRP